MTDPDEAEALGESLALFGDRVSPDVDAAKPLRLELRQDLREPSTPLPRATTAQT